MVDFYIGSIERKWFSISYVSEINQTLLPSKKPKYTVLDLFAGCGGLSLGFESAGFKSIGMECDEHCYNTYVEKNMDLTLMLVNLLLEPKICLMMWKNMLKNGQINSHQKKILLRVIHL